MRSAEKNQIRFQKNKERKNQLELELEKGKSVLRELPGFGLGAK